MWEHRYTYTWEYGVYLGAGIEKQKMALLCVVGALEYGEKEFPQYLTIAPAIALMIQYTHHDTILKADVSQKEEMVQEGRHHNPVVVTGAPRD